MSAADRPQRPACPDCTAGTRHCHATFLVHGDGTGECTGDAPCRDGREMHLLTVACREVGGGCRCR